MTKNSLEYPKKPNPITTVGQYALMQAIAHGAVPQQDVSISQEIAREMIRKTPRRLRSKFAAEMARMRHNKKKNPSAEALTEEWHGRQPREVIDYEEEEEYEPDGAVLAELEELGILLEDREQTISIEFNSDPPMLVANVATENLEIVGGDQKLEFGEGWGSTKNEFTVGHVYLIAYCTDKHHLEGSNGVPESYEHFFGEEFYKENGYKVDDYKESDDFFEDILEAGLVDEAIEAGYLPTMVYDTINEKIKLVGGRYTIEDVGLRD